MALRPGPRAQIVTDIKQALVSLVDERGIVPVIVLDDAQGLRDAALAQRIVWYAPMVAKTDPQLFGAMLDHGLTAPSDYLRVDVPRGSVPIDEDAIFQTAEHAERVIGGARDVLQADRSTSIAY